MISCLTEKRNFNYMIKLINIRKRVFLPRTSYDPF